MPKVKGICEYCGSEKWLFPSDFKRFRFCSRKCQGYFLRESTTKPDGHFHIDYYGYKRVKHNGKFIPEHRKVMSEHLGRELASEEEVHHRDGNKLNNDISNLELTTRSEHIDMHRKELIEKWREKSPWKDLKRDENGRFLPKEGLR